MNGAFMHIVVRAGFAAWLIALTAGSAFAQNFSGIVATESAPAVSDDLDGTEEPFARVSLGHPRSAEESAVPGLKEMPEEAHEPSRYTLGKEDVIEIAVQRHPEVSGRYVINNEGSIQYEFIGDVKVEGLKKDEVKDLLTNRLSDYIISPDVTVKIVGYNSKVVYIIGEVGRPGKIFMRGDTITVREALVQAGLPLLSAKASRTRLITPSHSKKPKRKIVNVDKLLYEGDLRENFVMKPGDTLYVPATILAKTLRVLQPITQPIGEAAGTGATVTTGF